MGVHAALHGANVRHGGEVQVPPPDEGADLAQEPLAQRPVSGHRAGLDHGRALPVLPHALVIGEGCGEADGGRGGRRVRPQPQIRAEDIAVRVTRLHKGANIPREPGEHRPELLRVTGVTLRVVDQDEVDIAGIVQLARAQLAHAEHHQAALGEHAATPRQRERAAAGRRAQTEGDACIQCRLGQGGQRGRDLAQRPHAADIGHRRTQRDPALGLAQGARDGRPVRGGATGRRWCAAPPWRPRPDRPATGGAVWSPREWRGSERYGLLPPSARSMAVWSGVRSRRVSAAPSSANRSSRRSAASGSAGAGQLAPGRASMCNPRSRQAARSSGGVRLGPGRLPGRHRPAGGRVRDRAAAAGRGRRAGLAAVRPPAGRDVAGCAPGPLASARLDGGPRDRPDRARGHRARRAHRCLGDRAHDGAPYNRSATRRRAWPSRPC